ncbi:hypothetical protein ALC56_02409 [Trachymyrmex septentrionalis]|uniref:Uncharacterized protein n=1 Tax=Trachymyrmex septentrionalis TaxID=34720 RepID=A0A195FTK7_9HYME|nr:hypothetical protein ALC56_02409 [Trachymyrmex septentrionalis]
MENIVRVIQNMGKEDLWNIVDEVLEDVNFEELNDNENASDDNGYYSGNSDQKRQCQNWFAKFRSGNFDVEDALRSGRPVRKGHILCHCPDHVVIGEVVTIRENRGWQRGIITDVKGDGTVAISLRDWGRNVGRQLFEVYPAYLDQERQDLIRYLINQQEGRMSILGTIRNEAALIKLDVRSGGDARERHQIDLKETLITLGYTQHSDKLRTGTYSSI